MSEKKKEEGFPKISSLPKKDMIVYISIAVLLILLIVISLSINSKINNQVKSLNEKIFGLESQISGQSDSQLLSLTDELEITKANIFSCDTDRNCDSLFLNRKYECPSSLNPTCVDKFCVCE